MTTQFIRNSIDRSPLRLGLPRVQPIWIIRGFLLIPLALAWFALAPTARAVSPARDGGYPGDNTAEGTDALLGLTTGIDDTANGVDALWKNTKGSFNTATGANALQANTTGSQNTATGVDALLANTIGTNNTATGTDALFSNKTINGVSGGSNTATGYSALLDNTTGSSNTADGVNALFHNTTGNGNIALGASAGNTLTTGSNNIDIGNGGAPGESNKIRIGKVGTQTATLIAGISGVAISGPPVVVNSSGQLGVAPSSKRFKDEIKPMDKASEAILALKPITFRYKAEIDPDRIPQFGLISEQVEKVNPALVARDANGKVYTVRYEAVNAMLLNEFLKAHRKVQAQEATITELKSTVAQQQKDFRATVAQLTARLDEQASQIQKVSAQVEVSKPAPRTVASNQ